MGTGASVAQPRNATSGGEPLSKVGVVFALFTAMAFLLMAMGNVFAMSFSKLSAIPLVITLLLGAYFTALMLKV